MTKRERPAEWATELYAELQEIRDELPNKGTTTAREDPTPVPNW